MRHNVVAYLALFLALSGTAIAARPLLTGADIQDESLTGADVQNDSLKGDDVLESSLGKVGDADTLDGKDSRDFAVPVAFAKVGQWDQTLADIPAGDRAGISDFSHALGSFYCFDLADAAKVGSVSTGYVQGDRFPRLDVPGHAFCPVGFRDASVVFASTSQNSEDQDFDVVFHR